MLDLKGKIVTVLGGDGREVEIVRQLVACGATVRTCGLPPGGAEASGTLACATIAEAVQDAEIVICPVPIPQADGSLYAPSAADRLIADTESLRPMRRGGILVTGRASAHMVEAASALGLRVREYEHEPDLMLFRAPAIAEGAIKIAIENTEVTLHRSACMVVGFGKIGPTLAQTLLGLGARVTVAARSPVQLARAWAMGCEPVHLRDLADRVGGVVVIFNTAPALLFTGEVLERLDPQTVLIDLSGPPGGVDFESARRLGRRAIWARGLGGRAPRTVGQSQWLGISRILAVELGSADNRPAGAPAAS